MHLNLQPNIQEVTLKILVSLRKITLNRKQSLQALWPAVGRKERPWETGQRA